MRRFEGGVAIVTGASAGIGEVAARGFAREGARVVLAARRAEPLEEVAAAIRAGGGEALVVPTDVGDVASCQALVAAALGAWGRVDVLVNNAGLHHRGRFEGHSAEQFAAMVDVNLRGPIVLTRAVLGPMLAARRGTIVNVASLAGCVPLPEAATYSATKFGLRAFSRALAEELRDSGVRVSLVSPGPVSTGFILGELETVSPLALSQPMSTAEEVGRAVLDAAADGKLERLMPAMSGALATLAYVWPGLARRIRPLMARRGERARARLMRGG